MAGMLHYKRRHEDVVVVSLLLLTLAQPYLQWTSRRAAVDREINDGFLRRVDRGVGGTIHTCLDFLQQCAVLGVDAEPVAAVGAAAATAHGGRHQERVVPIVVVEGRQELVDITRIR
jgi:hypothetical protein